MYKIRRKLLSQNFIYNQKLINSLVSRSSIDSKDTVLEIGPGKGFITDLLLKKAQKVIAVELDAKLVLHLQKFYLNNPKLDLYLANILDFPLPKFSYKIFANIPFSIEGKIIRKLVDAKNPPEDCYLVVRKDLAERLSAKYRNNQFFIKHAPWFDFSIHYYFKRSDFIPKPSMECVMLRIQKKQTPLLNWKERKTWDTFIERGYGNGLELYKNLKYEIRKKSLQEMYNKLGLSMNAKPGDLSINHWLEAYKICTSHL